MNEEGTLRDGRYMVSLLEEWCHDNGGEIERNREGENFPQDPNQGTKYVEITECRIGGSTLSLKRRENSPHRATIKFEQDSGGEGFEYDSVEQLRNFELRPEAGMDDIDVEGDGVPEISSTADFEGRGLRLASSRRDHGEYMVIEP